MPALYEATAKRVRVQSGGPSGSPSQRSHSSRRYLVPYSMLVAGSCSLLGDTPMASAVAGIIWHSPMAPARLRTCGRNPLSCRTMALRISQSQPGGMCRSAASRRSES